MTESRKNELSEIKKYIKPYDISRLKKLIIKNPYLYSLTAIFKTNITRKIKNANSIKEYKNKKALFKLNKNESTYLDELKRNGVLVLDSYFDISIIEELEEKVDELFNNLEIDKTNSFNVCNGKIDSLEGLTYDEIAFLEVGVGLLDPFLNLPEFVDIAFDELILKLAINYYEYIPISIASSSRSFPHYPPMEASYFHKDSFTEDCMHVFIYLNDVDEKSGPFCCIPGSHKLTNIKSFRPTSNYIKNINECYGNISDSEILKYYDKSEIKPCYGKKGTVVIVDANILHKGPLWKDFTDNKCRDILKLNFRNFDLNTYKNNIKIKNESVKNFSELQKLFLNPYSLI